MILSRMRENIVLKKEIIFFTDITELFLITRCTVRASTIATLILIQYEN